MNTLTENSGGITDVPGFYCSGVHCDVRGNQDERLDLAIIYSQQACTAAGVFTTNDVKAAPVIQCREILADGSAVRGIVANSGNANACTGDPGLNDARDMAKAAESACSCPQHSFLVCSTGRIGRALPMQRIVSGINQAAAEMGTSPDHGMRAARAIMTSDTRPKAVTARFQTGAGQTVSIAGIAKGAGMIEPNMATMLAFIATDACCKGDMLQAALKYAVDDTFNAITVDGDMSTNDTVLLLANGVSGVELQQPGDRDSFDQALRQVCQALAEKIVGDGERVTKFVELRISGAPDQAAAEKVARAIGNSLLVKSSWFGNDPNWGRLLDAAGYARVGLREELLDLYYGDVPVIVGGKLHEENLVQWKEIVARKRFSITLDLHLGSAAYRLLSTDLSTGYVDFNKSE